jgi:hypothetical protein
MQYTRKCRYEIQEQKEVPVCYTGISNTGWNQERASTEKNKSQITEGLDHKII